MAAMGGASALAVGGYVIDLRVTLGYGYRCQVYIATHATTGARVAARVCTVPAPREYDHHSLRAMALGEIHIMQLLGAHHPNIAPLLDAVVEERRIVTFLELSPHGDLLEWLLRNGGRLTEPQARRLMRQLLSALAFTHAAHIAHRDIKLENVLLLTDDSVATDSVSGRVALRVQLIDWNLSTCAPLALTSSSGSPAYAAPELLGNPDTTCYNGLISDVWSLGVVAYTLLVGGQPFSDATSPVDKTFDAILTQAPYLPLHLSPAACVLLTEMLCKDPARRPPAAQLQKHAWTLEPATEPIYSIHS